MPLRQVLIKKSVRDDEMQKIKDSELADSWK
jgi:hypothetical protein